MYELLARERAATPLLPPLAPAGAPPGPEGPARAPSPRPPRQRRRRVDRTVRNAGAGFSANLVQLIAALVTAVALARMLSPEEVGRYYLLSTVTVMLSLVSSFGVEASNAVFAGRREETPGRLHSASLLLAALFGGMAVALARAVFPVAALGLADRLDRVDYLLALLTTPFLLYQNLIYSLLIGTGHLVLMSRLKIGVALLRLAADLSVLSLGLGVRGLVVAFLACSALGALAAPLFSARITRPQSLWSRGFASSTDQRLGSHPPAPSIGPALRLVGRMVRFGVKTHLGTLADRLHFRSDTFLLNAMHGTGAVGIYSVAVQIAELPWLFFGAVGHAVFSRVSGLQRPDATRFASSLVRLGFLAWLATVASGVLLLTPLVALLLGPRFAGSAPAFALLLPGTAAVGVVRLLTPFFLGQLKRPGLVSAFSWLGLAVNLGLCLALIPRLEAAGAAVASAISYLGVLGMLLAAYRQLTGEPARNLLRVHRGDLRRLAAAGRQLLASLPVCPFGEENRRPPRTSDKP